MKEKILEISRMIQSIIDKYDFIKKEGGEIICFPSGKGGVGKTTLAVNIGSNLALKGKNVLLVDLNLALPNLQLFLKEKPETTLTHFLSSYSELTPCKIKIKDTELFVLPSESIVDLESEIEIGRLISGLNKFKTHFDFIILDVGPGLSKYSVFPLTVSDRIFIVSTDDKPSYENVLMLRAVMHLSGLKEDGIIVNKTKTTDPSKLKYFGKESIFGLIPYDRFLRASFLRGEPIYNSYFRFFSKSRKYIDVISSKILGGEG
jgi:MinD-like ATPase involved in chromosome partitioning or flagellar assembly